MLVTPKEAPEPDIPATPELLVGLEPPVALEILTGPEMQPALEFSHKFKRCLQKRESVADCDPEPKSPPIHEGPHIPVATSLYDQPFDPDLSFEDYKKLLGKHPSRRRDAKLTFARKAVILYLQLLGDGVIRDNVTSLAEIVDLFGLLQADITEIISSPLFQWLLRESYSIASAPEEGMENASGGNEEEVTESSDEVTNPVSPEEHAKLLNTPQPPIYPYDWESGKRHVSSGRLRGRRLFLRSDIEDVFGDSEASDLLEDFEPGLKNFLEIFVEGHPDEDINDSYIDPHADENALLPWGGSEVENEETIDVLDDFVGE
ncbi:hypothetical protein CC78DRAFT_138028 [Lojkania enalia]|uniref:Uncharacterized protein n=1 Tax=Lojkania enalia TaxID=147567 RepID=A0A9P4TRI3_9PLEO|nr:hypothetical protein CC78DRAFT_138028 [Didymosphaeria enalia]